MPPNIRHVALLIETSRSYGRGLLRGVRRYMAEHGPWSAFMELRALDSKAPPWLKNWQGDGILTRTGNQAMADAILKTGVPAIELRATRLQHDFPFVGVDNRALGRMVAEHLLDRGFRHFGVYQLDYEIFFEQRCENFVASLQEAGHTCDIYRASGHLTEKPTQWEKHQDDLARWLLSLPKPVGLMACTDHMGYWLLDACKRARVAVPEEVAVVGVENDESLCTMAMPPLSSVHFNAERTGYEAASLLDRLMAGEPPPPGPTLIGPARIVTRQSSDIVAIDDRPVAAALHFIREHACEGITVEDVLNAVPLSRSVLERRMRAAIGRTPKAEIVRMQLNRVKELLSETDLKLEVVARKAGFKHPQYLSAVFKQKFGITPGTFRNHAQGLGKVGF